MALLYITIFLLVYFATGIIDTNYLRYILFDTYFVQFSWFSGLSQRSFRGFLQSLSVKPEKCSNVNFTSIFYYHSSDMIARSLWKSGKLLSFSSAAFSAFPYYFFFVSTCYVRSSSGVVEMGKTLWLGPPVRLTILCRQILDRKGCVLLLINTGKPTAASVFSSQKLSQN